MRTFALLFGIIFLIIGIAGFMSSSVVNDNLFKVFRFNIWLNSLHILSGIPALIVTRVSRSASRLYFQVIGILYAILALLGFIYGGQEILGIFSSNRPDTWFHVIIAIAALVLAYGAAE